MTITAPLPDLASWVSLIQDTAKHGSNVAAETLSNLKWDITLAKRMGMSFERDFTFFHEQDFLFCSNIDVEQSTQSTISMLKSWLVQEDSSTNLVAICAAACEHLAIQDPTHRAAIVMAGLLGEIENHDEFHNNMHFRKVVLQTIRVITTHNHIHDGTDMVLDTHEMSTLLIAACIHDLAHNGKGNFAGGEHYPGYLEQQSFNTARPYLEEVGFSDPKALGILNALILSTDVSSSSREPVSFYEQMKMAYMHHYNTPQPDLEFSEPMLALNNPRTALLAAALHEADIATSAGISYEVSQVESRLLAEETGISIIGTPQGLSTFLEQICCGGMVLEASNRLYKDNMERIIKQAHHDIEHNSNAPFPEIKNALLLKA